MQNIENYEMTGNFEKFRIWIKLRPWQLRLRSHNIFVLFMSEYYNIIFLSSGFISSDNVK